MSLLARRIGAQQSNPAAPTYSDVVLEDSPVSYWRLGESSGVTAVDEQGVNDGGYTNTPTLGVTGAIADDADTAVSFDGSTEYVHLGAALSGDTTYSLECWFKTGYTGGTSQYFFSFGNSGNINHLIALYINASTDTLGWWTKDGTTNLFKDDTGSTVNDDNWHHVVGTRDGDTMKLYLDGSLLWTINGSSQGASTINRGAIGALARTTHSNYFEGEVDEAAVYDTVLSATRVSAHYDAGIGA